MRYLICTAILVAVFCFQGMSVYASETIFNSKGERIELKDDGTYVNHGVPTASDGFVISIVGVKPFTSVWGSLGKKETYKLKVKIVNNSNFNIKRMMLSFASLDDLGESSGDGHSAQFGTVRKGKSQIAEGANVLGKCDNLTSGSWKIKGRVNQYAFKVHEKGISVDDLLELVKFSNAGLAKFANASD